MNQMPSFHVQIETAQELTNFPFELQGLTQAVHYQKWLSDRVAPYLGHSILEFGAGVGNLSRWLPVKDKLILSELDTGLFGFLDKSTQQLRLNKPQVRILPFTLGKDDPKEFQDDNIDTIISFNVMEHIQDDESALRAQLQILETAELSHPGSRAFRRIIGVVPAHPFAYGEMDKTFEHFRRYSSDRVHALTQKVCPTAQVEMKFMNVVGLFGWWLQGRIFKKKQIGLSSIQVFEKLCPYLRPLDDFIHDVFRLPLGQSLIFVITLNMENSK